MKRMSVVLLLGLVALLGACGPSPSRGDLPVEGVPGETDTPLALPSPKPTPFSFEGAVAEEPAGQEVVQESAPSPQVEMMGSQHTVQAGETLLGIAMTHGVPMAAIQLQNGMGASTVVKVGEVLEIPPADAWSGAAPFWIVHEVSSGETLSEIARAYEVEMADLQAVNALPNGDALRAGQALVLPLDGPAVARAPEPTPLPPEPTPVPTVALVAAATDEPTAVASEPPTPQPTSPPPAAPPADVADWPRELVRLINEVRAAEGLPPYIYNETLARAAQLHAEDCQQRGSCSHTGSDGSGVKERIVRAGYVGTGYAECWAQRPDPQGALDIWMDEVYPQEDGTVVFGPHRKMMLHTWFTEIGVGIAESRWGYYFIADFGRP